MKTTACPADLLGRKAWELPSVAGMRTKECSFQAGCFRFDHWIYLPVSQVDLRGICKENTWIIF